MNVFDIARYFLNKLFGPVRTNIFYFVFSDNLDLQLLSDKDEFNFELPELDDVYSALLLRFPSEQFDAWAKRWRVSSKDVIEATYSVDSNNEIDFNSFLFRKTKI